MLPVFYQTHLEKYLSQAQMISLKLLVWLLQNLSTIKNRKVGSNTAKTQFNIIVVVATYNQRFLNLTKLSVVILWFPLIKEIVSSRIVSGKQLIIALDRTQWQENNNLMTSAIYQKRAFPIFWIILAKKGASNLREQQNILRPVIKLFRTHKIVIGLYGHNWIVAFLSCQEWVQELIDCVSNKRAFYRRGLRAITLIQQAL
jgi:hypothetical protein